MFRGWATHDESRPALDASARIDPTTLDCTLAAQPQRKPPRVLGGGSRREVVSPAPLAAS
eukprot:14873253-Alexandrium_andersonii.AAC.1